jgi:hypothetical protein
MSSGFDTEISPFTPTSQAEEDTEWFNTEWNHDLIINSEDTITPPVSIQKPPESLSPLFVLRV